MAATNKTLATDASVQAFLDGLADERQRAESRTLIDLMEDVTGRGATMWGSSIIGFGTYHYVYESGREGDMCQVGFSPRKGRFAIYIIAGFTAYDALMARLGTFKTGKSCLYVTRLDRIDLDVLRELVEASVAYVRATWETDDPPVDVGDG